MTECKKVIVDKLAKEKVIMYFTRYVDDTFLIIKNRDINYVLNQFNKFDKKLKFTGQYVLITSYTLWRWKIFWIRSLVIRVKKICSDN